jgi:hypothetical protein
MLRVWSRESESFPAAPCVLKQMTYMSTSMATLDLCTFGRRAFVKCPSISTSSNVSQDPKWRICEFDR